MSSTPASLPQLHLLLMEEKFCTAITSAIAKHWPQFTSRTSLTIHDCSLNYLASKTADLVIDAVVSPANSYARLDGAFDDALARTYGPRGDYAWITRKAQKVVYGRWRGFAPVGTCTVVPLTEDTDEVKQPFGTKFLLLCPTMAVPENAVWDRRVVYECIWSFLCEVEQHNKAHAGEEAMQIRSILMPPLATGVGKIRPERWAEQVVLAFQHWTQAVEEPEIYSGMDWEKVFEIQNEVEKTWKDDVNS